MKKGICKVFIYLRGGFYPAVAPPHLTRHQSWRLMPILAQTAKRSTRCILLHRCPTVLTLPIILCEVDSLSSFLGTNVKRLSQHHMDSE